MQETLIPYLMKFLILFPVFSAIFHCWKKKKFVRTIFILWLRDLAIMESSNLRNKFKQNCTSENWHKYKRLRLHKEQLGCICTQGSAYEVWIQLSPSVMYRLRGYKEKCLWRCIKFNWAFDSCGIHFRKCNYWW